MPVQPAVQALAVLVEVGVFQMSQPWGSATAKGIDGRISHGRGRLQKVQWSLNRRVVRMVVSSGVEFLGGTASMTSGVGGMPCNSCGMLVKPAFTIPTRDRGCAARKACMPSGLPCTICVCLGRRFDAHVNVERHERQVLPPLRIEGLVQRKQHGRLGLWGLAQQRCGVHGGSCPCALIV